MRPLSLSSSTYDNLLLGELYRYIRVHDSSRSGGRRGQILVEDLWRYMKIFYPSTVHAKGAFTLDRDVGSLLD